MAILTLDFRDNPLPDLVKGIPEGRGFRFTLRFRGLAQVIVSDSIWQYLKVPNDEHWYIKQWFVDDGTKGNGFPNGWASQVMTASFPLQESPQTVDAVKNNAPWTEDTHFQKWSKIWNRWSDGVSFIYWEDRKVQYNAGDGTLIVRCTDPVWSECRWGPGTEIRLKSLGAEFANIVPDPFDLEMNVIRYRLEDADLKRLVKLDGPEFVSLTDQHMQEHRPILGQ